MKVRDSRRRARARTSPQLLAALAVARAAPPAQEADANQRLARFLHTALDKRDQRFENPSYFALDGLELPAGDAEPLAAARRTHHSVAGRMLGDRRGTGDTEGRAYLTQGLAIPVFASRCPLRAAA